MREEVKAAALREESASAQKDFSLNFDQWKLIRNLMRFAQAHDYFDVGCLDPADDEDAQKISSLALEKVVFDELAHDLRLNANSVEESFEGLVQDGIAS